MLFCGKDFEKMNGSNKSDDVTFRYAINLSNEFKVRFNKLFNDIHPRCTTCGKDLNSKSESECCVMERILMK
jgi:hypothetical protein